MSLTVGEELPKKVRLSCFHDAGADGEASIRAELGNPMELDLMQFYKEALSRLPIADMPEILSCVIRGGHCIGLLDPVSNIIFNALNHLCRRKCGGGSRNIKGRRPCAAQVNISKGKEEKEKGPPTEPSFVLISFRSYNGLIAFMRIYFRYLSMEQAMLYLRLAGADLAAAVQLGENQQFAPEDRPATGSPDLCCGRTQFALKVAAFISGHPVPDDLVRLAKFLVPLKDHTVLAAVLKKGVSLSVSDINGILNFLRLQHYAASPAVQVTFQSRPYSTGMDLSGLELGGLLLDSDKRPGHYFCPLGENYVADVVVSRSDGHISSICDLRAPEMMKKMLLDSLNAAATTIVKYTPQHIGRNLIAAPSTTACQCEHTRYLKMCLTDTIHALYIKAVSLLPHNALHKHLRGILVAGHCYGPLDPVSNIIRNAIWYDSVYPLLEIDTVTEPDILDSQSMLRMEARSLDSLLAMICTASGFSEHMALEYLCYKQCDLSVVLQRATKEVCYKAYVAAGQAGKHPYHLELASFLTSMPPQDTLLTGEATGKGYVISDAVLEQVYKIMEGQSPSTAPSDIQPRLRPQAWMMLASRKDEFAQKQKFLGQILEQLLLDYSNQHPWEPVPRLDVICGVKKGDHGHSKFYHVNFLVYYDDVSSARMLFFAEVWESSFQAKRSGPNTSVSLVTQPCTRKSRQVESGVQFVKVYSKSSRKQSKTSFCCPLPHYSPDHPYLGRCDVCEPISSKIAHPPSGNHIGANYKGLGELLEYLNVRHYNPSAADAITESDFVYFDCLRDAKIAEVLSDMCSLEEKKLIIR
ncbi:uncharacterized protein LOC125516217 [Triticum urartu]|uniref:uncharacterized protein LOC125516217 n=1 Tax=Triticum urartu TaxID=4572 RepID=UPI002042F5AD|nr:uncharacterized protein LOC125516217 [Triticum urartu]